MTMRRSIQSREGLEVFREQREGEKFITLDNREHRTTCRTQLLLVSPHPLHLRRDAHRCGLGALLFVLELWDKVQDHMELGKEVCTHRPEQTKRNAPRLQGVKLVKIFIRIVK